MFNKLRKKIHAVPDKKRYIDFIAALFALPVMATVLIINVGNLQNKDNGSDTPSPQPNTIVIETTPQSGNSQVTPQEACKKKVGPIEITSPREGQTVSANPVNILINYNDPQYCSVVWSYRINGGGWSEFTSNSISLYNPPQGDITLDLRVQSTVSRDQTELQRTFEYHGSTISPTIIPSPTEAQKEN